MSGIHDDVDLGHTVAGWTGCVIALTGFAGAGVAMCAGRPLGVWLGLGVILSGGLITWALHLMGWGKPSGTRPREQWDWRVKDPMTGHRNCLACRLAGGPIVAGGGADDRAGMPAADPVLIE
jgi:hypothetical protein